MVTADALREALVEAGEAIAQAPDPAGALARLRRWARRERGFGASPAAIPIDNLIQARTSGINPQLMAGARRLTVYDRPTTTPKAERTV